MSKLDGLWKPAFCALLMAGSGCALTDYALITDNDQTRNGRGSGIVDTNGKAHVLHSSQLITSWPDGSEETFSMVDQKANGDRTLTTYTNRSTGTEPIFHDDLYCNPDWQGCSVLTSPDPEVGDVDVFDGRWNRQCLGFRDIDLLYGSNRYYGECGRARLSLTDRLALLNMGRIARRYGLEGLLYEADRDDLTISISDRSGVPVPLAISGKIDAFVALDGRRRAVLDLTNPLLAGTVRAYADYLRSHDGRSLKVTLAYNGISATFDVGGERNTADNWLAFANRSF